MRVWLALLLAWGLCGCGQSARLTALQAAVDEASERRERLRQDLAQLEPLEARLAELEAERARLRAQWRQERRAMGMEVER